jgi:hypothetical protein
LSAAHGFRTQGVDDHRSFTRDDDAAAERPAGRERGVHEVAGNEFVSGFQRSSFARQLALARLRRYEAPAKEKRDRRKDSKKKGS